MCIFTIAVGYVAVTTVEPRLYYESNAVINNQAVDDQMYFLHRDLPGYGNVCTVLLHVYNNKRAGLITEDNEFILAICFFVDIKAIVVCIYDTIFTDAFLYRIFQAVIVICICVENN